MPYLPHFSYLNLCATPWSLVSFRLDFATIPFLLGSSFSILVEDFQHHKSTFSSQSIMDGIAGPSTNHLNVPYAERWGLLKDVMARLYMDEKKKLKEIVEIMKADYRFYASSVLN